jgi:hypothetical protein
MVTPEASIALSFQEGFGSKTKDKNKMFLSDALNAEITIMVKSAQLKL